MSVRRFHPYLSSGCTIQERLNWLALFCEMVGNKIVENSMTTKVFDLVQLINDDLISRI